MKHILPQEPLDDPIITHLHKQNARRAADRDALRAAVALLEVGAGADAKEMLSQWADALDHVYVGAACLLMEHSEAEAS